MLDETFGCEITSSVACLSCGCVSSSTEPFHTGLTLPIPGWESVPARMPAGRCRLTEAQGRRHQEVLAALPSGLKEPPAQLGLASCLQAFAAP